MSLSHDLSFIGSFKVWESAVVRCACIERTVEREGVVCVSRWKFNFISGMRLQGNVWKGSLKLLGGVEGVEYKLTVLPIEYCELDYLFVIFSAQQTIVLEMIWSGWPAFIKVVPSRCLVLVGEVNKDVLALTKSCLSLLRRSCSRPRFFFLGDGFADAWLAGWDDESIVLSSMLWLLLLLSISFWWWRLVGVDELLERCDVLVMLDKRGGG
jgi:hypothetical protein